MLVILPAILGWGNPESTYKVPLQLTRFTTIEMELGIPRVHQMIHECWPRRESPYGGVLLLLNMRLGLVMMVVGMMASINGHGGRTGAVASNGSRCIDNGGIVAFGHGETKRKK